MISFPAVAYADEGNDFWGDPLGSIASFFGFDDSTDAPEPYAAGDESKVADASTINDWQNYLLNDDGHATTENIGRIWNDKSVSTGDVTLTGGTADEITVTKGDSDFLVAFSALSSMSNTTATITEPLDIVLVLDVSGSMDDGLYTYEYSPTYSVNTNGRTDYFAQTSTGSYSQIERITGSWGRFDHWEFNGEPVDAKTSESDSDSGHIQFYTRQSTGSTPKITALKNAVGSFIDSMNEANAQISDTADQSRIAIVKFADDTYRYTIGDNKGAGGNSDYNYTQVVSDFTSNAEVLKSDINGIDAGGATSADFGLTLAKDVLEGGTHGSGNDRETYTGARSEAKRVVIFFTDGEPNHSSGFSESVANDAIDVSGDLKADGTIVYSIGVFEDADPSDTSEGQSNRFNAYMHGVSSNYPNAETYGNLGDRAPESDYYKAAADADELSNIFEDIFNDVSSGTGSPTEIEEGFDAAHGGYITFTDQLDDYMKVDDFKSIVFANEKFENPKVSSSLDTTTYIFEGQTSTPIYPSGDLSDIIITVEHSTSLAEGDLVTVKIPASLIPVRNFKVDADKGTMSVDEAYPIRVFYGVSLKDNVAEALRTDNASGAIESVDEYSALESYAADHIIDGKAAAFYSNDWVSGDAGSTIASFSPSSSNSFYFFTKDTPVFNDEACQQRASVNDVKNGKTYYRQTYYESNGEGGYTEVSKVNELQPNFVEFDQAYWDADDQGQVYIKAGAPHLTRTNDFYTEKLKNESGTVEDVQNPTWAEDNKTMNSRLGNNGRLLVELLGTLSVTKNITADAGLDTSRFGNTSFTFDIEVKDAEGAAVNGAFPAEVKNAQGETVSDPNFALTFVDGKVQHSIKPDETLYLYGLTAGSSYTVTEAEDKMPAGFTQTLPADNGSATGTIAVNAVTPVMFTNNYRVTPLEYDTSAGFQVEKILEGRDWLDGDSFTFNLNPVDDAPAADSSVATVTKDSADHKASFGKITFTKPGKYTYTIEEDDGTNPIVGIDYSGATFRIDVTVIDNLDGTLSASAKVFKTEDEDGVAIDPAQELDAGDNVVFFNTYKADSVTLSGRENFQGLKTIDGRNGLEGEVFEFTMEKGDATDGGDWSAVTMKDGKVFDKATATATMHADSASASYWFDDLTFAKAGSYTFNVTETGHNGKALPVDGTNAMTYDRHTGTITVVVTDDGTGELTATATAGSSADGKSTDFVNRYAPQPATYGSDDELLGGDKFMNDQTGGFVFADDQFVFVMRGQSAGIPMPEGLDAKQDGQGRPIVSVQNTRVNDDQGAYDFGEIVFEHSDMTGATDKGNGIFEKAFRYNIFEDDSTVPGVTKDNAAYTVTFTVTENQNTGVMTVAASAVRITSGDGNNQPVGMDQLDFTNTHDATKISGYQNIFKTIEGRDFQAGDEFVWDISMTATDEHGTPMPKDQLPTVDDDISEPGAEPSAELSGLTYTEAGDGFSYTATIKPVKTQTGNTYRFSAGKITYEHVGTYTYTVKEQASRVAGVTSDDTEYTVVVAITEENGALKRVATVTPEPSANGTLDFTNVYESDPASVGTEAAFDLTKQLTGREGNAWADGDSFEFTLTGKDGAPMPADAESGSKTAIVTKDDVTDAANGIATIDFGDIAYTTAGTYTYTVIETNAGKTIDGVTHAGNTVTVTVTVTDNGVGGLVAAVAKTGENKNEAGDGASFVNTYSSTVNYGDVGGVDVTKVLSNRDMTAGQFAFTVTSEDEAALAKIGGKAVTMSSAAATAGTAVSVMGDPLDAIAFDRSDSGKDFAYTIDEVQESGNGYTCDTSVYTVTITPHDNGDGTMSITTVVADSDGEHNMTVESAATTDKKVAVVPFGNIYAADPVFIGAEGDVTIVAHKTLKNDDIANYAGMFDFAVTSGDVTVAEGRNDADGTVTFDSIEYTSANLYAAAHGGSDEVGTATLSVTDDADVYTFAYSVSENAANLPEGVSYERGNGTATVIVTDNRAGELSVSVAYDSGGEGLEFVNVYGASEQAQLTLTGTKGIVGINGAIPPALTDGMFGFTITGSEGAPMPDEAYAENTGATVAFGPITYTMENVFGDSIIAAADESVEVGVDEAAGVGAAVEGIEPYTAGRTKTFTYTVSEDASKTVPGVANDASAKTVEVTVTDNGDGTLTAAVTKVSEGTAQGMDFSFANTYSVTPIEKTPTGEGGLTITKVWDRQSGSRELAAGDFSFAMLDGDGNVVSRGTNDADGNVAMSPVKYAAEGQYAYELVEVVPDGAKPVEGGYEKDGVFYVANSYVVTANVSDNHDGTLGITWTMKAEDGTETDTAEFVNVYSANPTTVTFGAAKSLEGRAMKAGEFEFELKDADGNVLGTAKNASNGTIVFSDAIQTFGNAGEYDFTVSEVLPDDDDSSKDGIQKEGVTYDETVCTAHVVIADDGKGDLRITELTYDGKAELPVFRNSYVEPATPEKPSVASDPEESAFAQTNDSTPWTIVLGVAAVALAGVALGAIGLLKARRR